MAKSLIEEGRFYRGGHRQIDGKWYCIIWDGDGNEISKEEFEPKPNPLLELMLKNKGKCKKEGRVEGMSVTVPLIGS